MTTFFLCINYSIIYDSMISVFYINLYKLTFPQIIFSVFQINFSIFQSYHSPKYLVD